LFNLEHCNNIKNFEALKYLRNIKQINLTNSNITEKELNTIPDLPNLTSLGLVGNNLTGIIEFPVLINLESLTLDMNPIKSINIPSNNLPKMKYLGISNTPISDAGKIRGLDNIEVIYMYDTKITKVAPFKKYKNLKTISTKLSDIEDKETLDGTNINIIQD
jgi:Leucine-rich repeat (LRR) protein